MSEARTNGPWALALALQILGLPAETSRIEHELGGARSIGEAELLRAARRFPVSARAIKTKLSALERMPLPAIARLKGDRFVVLGSVSDGKVLYQGESDPRPLVVSLETFAKEWTQRLICLSKKTVSTDPAHRFGLGWFWTAISKYRRVLYEVLIASFVIQLFSLATPLIFQNVIDKVLVHRGMSTLEVLVAGLALIALFDTLLSGLRTYLFSHTSNRIDVELGSRIFRHLLSLPLAYFQNRRVGDSVARVRELETIRQFLTGSAVTLVLDLIFGTIFLSVMYLYSAVLALIVTATLPLYALLSIGVTPSFRRRLEEKFERSAENQAFLVESVTGMETIKAMAIEPRMHRRWEEQCAAYVDASFKATALGNVATQATGFINKVTNALTLFVGAGLVIRNQLTVGELVAFNMLAGQVSGPVLRVAQVWQDFNQIRISVDRLGDILNTPVEPHRPGTQTEGRLRGEITFERLTFRYNPQAQPVLREVDLKIEAGQLVGIVGPSGSGKSTIAKLIQRLYLPESGRVLVDGLDTAMIDPAWMRRQIGVVLQENVLFNGSVRDNIALIDPALPLTRVIEAAKLAGAHDFISRMPQGYDTQIGERGVSLSGGQRQRLAIARALIGDPRILIFDEATSALDYESESVIQENMRQIVAGRTVIVIAHRLSTVRAADRILTIEDGKVVEDGGHEELLMRDGRYAMLHRIQAAMR
jgi:subfamily B ATP-binding cassette protein HlyB/CyaB